MNYFETSITIRVNKVQKVQFFELEQNYKCSQCFLYGYALIAGLLDPDLVSIILTIQVLSYLPIYILKFITWGTEGKS